MKPSTFPLPSIIIMAIQKKKAVYHLVIFETDEKTTSLLNSTVGTCRGELLYT